MGSTAPTPSSSTLETLLRDAWVDTQLIHTFMRFALPALSATGVMTVVVVVMLYGDVASFALWLWTAAALASMLTRFVVIKMYQRKLAGSSGLPLHAYMGRYGWVWTLSAVIWGASSFLFLGAPLQEQFLCMLILIGMGGFAVGTFSSYFPIFSRYVGGLNATIVVALAWQLLTERGKLTDSNTLLMIVMMMTYWVVVSVAGKRFHGTQRANFELQFENAQLIASLTEKSNTALEAVASKNRFIASAAHDLRQPVHALDIYAGWLVAEPEFVAHIAPKIVRSTRAVNELFDSLFELAGLEADPLKVNFQRIDLAALVQDLELQYAPLALERGVQLRTRVAPGMVSSDPVLLKRLMGNLLSNALKNTHQGGVLLALRKRRGVWCLQVWDTGAGIAEAHQQAIFEEFYRVPSQGTEHGFGLGLAIVRRLSHALGHPVGMASRPGRGSVFWVELKQPEAVQPA